jgi:hypothetical protein
MNAPKTCDICKRVDPPYGIGTDGACLDIQACYEEFRLHDLAEQANKDAGSH